MCWETCSELQENCPEQQLKWTLQFFSHFQGWDSQRLNICHANKVFHWHFANGKLLEYKFLSRAWWISIYAKVSLDLKISEDIKLSIEANITKSTIFFMKSGSIAELADSSVIHPRNLGSNMGIDKICLGQIWIQIAGH